MQDMGKMGQSAGNRRNRKLYNRKKYRQKTGIFYALFLVVVLSIVGTALFFAFRDETDTQIAMNEQTETVPAQKDQDIPEETQAETETEPEEVFVEITAANQKDFVTVGSCEIDGSGAFALKGSVENKPVSDDEKFYLFSLKTYEEELSPEAEPIASTDKELEFSLKAEVNENSADSRLYSKFVVAVKLDGEYVALSTPYYITNPEKLAGYTAAFPETASIKGLLVDPQKLATNELDELGVKHAAYNIPVARILGGTTNSTYPTIKYTYNGKTYNFNGHVISEYDYVFNTLTRKGIVITAIVLNSKSSAYPELIHPRSRNGKGHYYAFNASDEDGTECLEAVAAFLARRYRDKEHGIVMNWIIGNEVNVRSDWNYMEYTDLDTYAREYARAVRVFYNGIKSMNANARIYISLDQQWDRNLLTNDSYDSRDLLETFNDWISREGNIDWGLAHHPYSVPLTWPKFWEMTGKSASLVTDAEDTSMITMKNLHVLTDYMQREELLTADGEVRPIILSEMGYTSSYGEDVQAAAFSYAYYIANNNKYIDALILSRETDAPEEVAQGLALGLCYQGGRKKYIYNVYKNIDTKESEVYTEFAKSYIGIQSWGQVITSR